MNFLNIKNGFFFIILIIVTILFFWLIGAFIFSIFWAIIFGIIFYPLYKKILKLFKNHKSISSITTIFLILIIIFIPLLLIINMAAKEAIEVYHDQAIHENIQKYINMIPYQYKIENFLTEKGLNTDEIKTNLISSIQSIVAIIGQEAISIGKKTIAIIINFFLMLYLLFFFFKDGKRILKRISEILPIGNKYGIQIFNKFTEIIKAMFSGTIIIALIQGILGGFFLFIVGVENFILLTIIMILLSIIPILGPAIVLIPAAIIFLLLGGIWQAIILIIATILISTIDNIFRPYLVGNATKMHDVLIILSIFGGLALFGITGFIIGPVIAGMFLTMWLIFEEKYKKDLKEKIK